MKLDLDDLERKVRESADECEELSLSHRQALALIARIRELQCALYSTIEQHYSPATIMGILDKGVVLP